MNVEGKVKLCNRIAALFMALMLLCQFVPYWHYGEGDVSSASINGYVWFPEDHKGLKAEMLANDADYYINDVAWPTIGLMLLCVAGVIFCLWKSHSAGACFLPAAGGLLGLWFYLTTPAMKIGGLWWLHVLLLALMLVVGAAGMAAKSVDRKNA